MGKGRYGERMSEKEWMRGKGKDGKDKYLRPTRL